MTICYNFASRSRPEKFFACLDNIHSLSRHDNFHIIATLDIDDSAMNTPEVRDRIATYPKVIPYWGFSASKIDAINKNICFAPPFDILCNHSDDMWFIKEGFDLDIIEAFQDFKGLVHFPDQVAGAKLITYAMMHREYYEIDGCIYYPNFFSVYADNFQQDIAKKRSKYKFVDKKILEHRHAIWGYGIADSLLKQTEDPKNYEIDRATYLRLTKEFKL